MGLEGVWEEVPQPRERVGKQRARSAVTLTVCGNVAMWTTGGRTTRQSLFTMGGTDIRREIDLVTVADGAFHTTRGLWRVEGDTLTFREGILDGVRPKALTPDEGGDDWPSARTFQRRP